MKTQDALQYSNLTFKTREVPRHGAGPPRHPMLPGYHGNSLQCNPTHAPNATSGRARAVPGAAAAASPRLLLAY